MLKRDAEAAFWMARYVERAEATARMVDVHYHYGLDAAHLADGMSWSSILAISGLEDDFRARYEGEDERDVIQFFAFDIENPGSILSCLRTARENARSIRDQVSSEMWECLNRRYLDLREWDVARVFHSSPSEFFARVKEGSHLFNGIAQRTLLLDEPRDFYTAGLFLERADQTARILDVKYHDLLPQGGDDLGGDVDVLGWIAVLRSVGALEAFRKVHQHGVTPARVADFLVLSTTFPASIRYCVAEVEAAIRRVSANAKRAPSNEAERAVGLLHNHLNYLRPERIILEVGLHEFLEDIQLQCAQVSDAIHETYLTT